MKSFVASVKLTFQDAFSQTAGQARSAFNGIGDALDGMQSKGASAMQTATQLSLIAASTDQYRQKMIAALEEPSEAAGKLESALAAASTVVTPELSIDGDYGKTMDALRTRALEWGNGTAEGASLASASAESFASTTYAMLSAGLRADAAMNATAQAMILAKGTMGDSKDAADLLAIAYNTMGDKSADSGAELQRLSDVVAKTQAAFQISNLSQLNDGLKYGIPVAQKYGIAWDELSAVVGQLNTSGLTGSLAGTAFSSMMAQMLTASKSLGFEVSYDESGSVSVIGTLENIRAKFGEIKDYTPEVTMAFDQAFGQEGSRALTLLSSSLDTLKTQYEGIADSEGQSAMMAGRMSDTYENKLAVMENSRTAMQARLGKSTNSVNGLIADVKTNFYNMASSILDSKVGGALAGVFSGSMVAASGLLGIGGTALNVASQFATFVAMTSQAGGMLALLKNGAILLATPFRLLGSLGKVLGTGLFSIGRSIIGLVPKMGAWIASAWAAATAHWAMLGPILLVIAAVAALAAGVYLVIKHWDSVKAFFANLWEGVKNIFSAAWNWISEGFSSFIDVIKKPFEWIENAFSKVSDWAGNAWGKVKDWLGFGKDKDDPLADAAAAVSGSDSLTVAVDAKTKEAGAFLPHSDADKGAFSKLSSSGAAIPETMASGMASSDALTKAASRTFGEAASAVTGFQGGLSKEPSPEWFRYATVSDPATGSMIPANAFNSSFTMNYGQDTQVMGGYQLPDFSAVLPKESDDGTASLLQKVVSLMETLIGIVKGKGGSGSVTIQNLNLPDVDDIDAVIKFVNDLKDQIDKETA